jgi:hypothetical protein
MKTVKEIQGHYSCDQIWSKIFDYKEKNQIDLGAFGNGFDRKGKAYLHDLIENYPQYKEEILGLF